MTPLLAMHSLGHNFVPAPIHAGGLRYHGMAPIVSQLILDKLIEPRAVKQLETFAAGVTWARTEGHIPAPETNHALAAVISRGQKCKEEGKAKTILVNWSGHGLVDMMAYNAYFEGKLTDYELPDEEIQKSLLALEKFPKLPRKAWPDRVNRYSELSKVPKSTTLRRRSFRYCNYPVLVVLIDSRFSPRKGD